MKAVRIFTRKFGHGTLLMFCQAHSSPGINLLENLSNALVKILESCLHGPSQVLFADNSGSPFLFLSAIKIMQVASKQISLGNIYICLQTIM